MTERARCPICGQSEVRSAEGALDQSGTTYLPTTVWTCDACGCVRYEPAPSARWRPLEPDAPEPQDVLERAAA
jgi:hypothetical protein